MNKIVVLPFMYPTLRVWLRALKVGCFSINKLSYL